MKDILKYDYNIYNLDIIENERYCLFIKNNKKYYLIPYLRSDEELKDIVLITDELAQKNMAYGHIIRNNKGLLYSLKDNHKYVLLEMGLNDSNELNVIDMLKISNNLVIKNNKSVLVRSNWGELWSKKVDYFEYQIRELGKDKKIVINSFSYYIGLAENAIAYYIHTIKTLNPTLLEHLSLQRRRIIYPNTYLNYFNPLNYVIDYEVRDIASYLKAAFFSLSYEELMVEVEAFLKNKKLSAFGYQLFYARLLYPSYYFDIYERIIEEELDEQELIPIISKIDDYEKFLKDVYHKICNYVLIEPIEWLLIKKEEEL